eukprot:s39_g1.t1
MIRWKNFKFGWWSLAWGHRQLAVRSAVCSVQASLSLVLCSFEIDVDHNYWFASCQLVASLSLFIQWRLANPHMFLIRSAACVLRGLICCHLFFCGRTSMFFMEDCASSGLADIRWPFRMFYAIIGVHWLLAAISLFLQFEFPLAGVTEAVGHEQLWSPSSTE